MVVDDTEYCDGGLDSLTNVDLLAELNLDLVIIISPMSGGLGPADTAFRGAARRRLRAEVVGLRKAGNKTPAGTTMSDPRADNHADQQRGHRRPPPDTGPSALVLFGTNQ